MDNFNLDELMALAEAYVGPMIEENSQETRAHLEAMVLRTKPEANQWLLLTPRVAALGADAFEQGPVMIKKIHAYLLKEVNLQENHRIESNQTWKKNG